MYKCKSLDQLFGLKGKTAVVTGAAGILGKYFCSGLAEAGANVAIVDLNKHSVITLAKEITDSYNIKAIGIESDVSLPESVNSMVDNVVSEFGEINILLNNAATKTSDLEAFLAPFEEYSLETWRQVMSVNIDGMFLVSQAVGKQMIAQGSGGSIIQTSSIYGLLSPDHRIYKNSLYLGRSINSPAVYAASKAAIIGLTKYLATYWGEKNIRVNSLVPGGVEDVQNDEFKENYSERVPMKRMAKKNELIGTLLYLASEASSYVTGQSIVVDGGLSAW